MSVEKNVLNFISKRKLKDEQFTVDSAINIEGGYNKILWAEVDVQIDSIEPLTREVSYSGKAIFDVHYLDTENKTKVFTNTVPFLNKFMDENITPTCKIVIIPRVERVDIDEKSERITALICLDSTMYVKNEIECICGCDDDVCMKTDDETAENLIQQDCTTFNEEFALDITDKMENILSVKSKVVIKDLIPARDYFTLDGEILTTLKYIQNGEEMERITTENFTQSVRREIEVVGLTENGEVEGFVCIKRDAFKYDVNRETKKINIVAPITLCYQAFEEMSMPVATDLFSLTHNLSVSTNSYTKTKILPSEFVENKIEGSVMISETDPRIDKIMGFSNANLVITNAFMENGELNIDGIVSFDIAYFNDESGAVHSTKKEIPFTIKASIEIPEGALIFPQFNLSDVEITARRGREIYFDAKLKSLVNIATEEQSAVITNVESGEAFETKKHSIEIYFGQKGDDVWDIAKELRTKPEIIANQNPNLILPLEQNENIVIYNQKV